MQTLEDLRVALRADIICQTAINSPIDQVLLDSRKLLFTGNSLFIAIKGVHNNSHMYLKDVYEAGVRNFVLEKGNYNPDILTEIINSNIIETDSGITALQTLAQLHRRQYSTEVIGITGSNGKTIVKEWLSHLLKDEINLVRSPKSYNSKIGVPLSVLLIQEKHQLGIFEAGISEPGEMEILEQIICPSLGILTVLGDAHDEGFKTRYEKLFEKSKLFKHCHQVIYGEEQEWVREYFNKLNTGLNPKKYLGWSRINKDADYYFEVEARDLQTLIKYKNQIISIPFTDEGSIWNACTCLSYLLLKKYSISNFKERFADLPVLDMRLQLKEGHQNCLLINDSYSADTGSLMIALEFMQQHASGNRKSVILSDFLETGKLEKELYTQIALQLQLNKVDQLIGIGDAITRNKDVFNLEEKHFFPSVKEFMAQYPLTNFQQQIILIKGARSFAFEKISKWLERKVHQTVFEINLNALVNNLNVYRGLLKPNVKLMAMVKAFSYGAGSYEIARVLSFNRVDYLTVAYADEGVELRKAGVKTPIMVMNPELQSFDTILQYNLEPEIYNLEILHSLIQSADGEEVGIHLELETGMKRLGFDSQQITELLHILDNNSNIKVRSVFTHLAASEDATHDSFTQQQITKFEESSAVITKNLKYPILRHCLNSGGIARFPNAQFDMVRLGIGLYGVNPSNEKLPLQTIGTLKTVISQIRTISKEESIGYGRKGKLDKDGRIAIVAIGYADGLDRKLSNGNGSMLIKGKKAKIVGNICMDLTMLDISEIECKVGDEVIVFGEKPSILELSEQIGTIPYEILTGVSQRVKRVYFYE